MNEPLSKVERLLTWLDVERLLKQCTVLWTRLPSDVLGVDCFASGMEVRYKEGRGESVRAWLMQVFGRAYLQEQSAIRLRIGQATYPIELIQEQGPMVSAEVQSYPLYPLWRDVTYLPTAQDNDANAEATADVEASVRLPQRFDGGPELVSFHSFKGGVGRTTALMTYVTACLRETSPGAKKFWWWTRTWRLPESASGWMTTTAPRCLLCSCWRLCTIHRPVWMRVWTTLRMNCEKLH